MDSRIRASKQSLIDNFKFLASKNKYDPTSDRSQSW